MTPDQIRALPMMSGFRLSCLAWRDICNYFAERLEREQSDGALPTRSPAMKPCYDCDELERCERCKLIASLKAKLVEAESERDELRQPANAWNA